MIKLKRAMQNLHREEKGMTGLETAIILIAFVTVAAVFGYAVLSAGLFSAERGKETIYAGLNEAKSNLELSGSVIGKGDAADPPTYLKTVKFTVKNAIAGTPIDMTPNTGAGDNKCVISLTTASQYLNNIRWSKVAIGNANGNDLLEPGEQFEITIDLDTCDAGSAISPTLGKNDIFNIQLKPSVGSTITVQRTLPAGLDPVMDLH
jgi:archaeal flagellin FlaB